MPKPTKDSTIPQGNVNVQNQNQNQNNTPTPTPATDKENFEQLLRQNQSAMDQLKAALKESAELLRKQANLETKIQSLEAKLSSLDGKVDKILKVQDENAKKLSSLTAAPAAPAATDPEPQQGNTTEPAPASADVDRYNLFLAAMPESERANHNKLMDDYEKVQEQLREQREINASRATKFLSV